jgi:hypothetical protein
MWKDIAAWMEFIVFTGLAIRWAIRGGLSRWYYAFKARRREKTE